MDKLRLRFWTFVHDSLEKAWHWVYYHKVHPLIPLRLEARDILYSEAWITDDESEKFIEYWSSPYE
jgi:hypothetical protein